jgi:hypothetical protein
MSCVRQVEARAGRLATMPLQPGLQAGVGVASALSWSSTKIRSTRSAWPLLPDPVARPSNVSPAPVTNGSALAESSPQPVTMAEQTG